MVVHQLHDLSPKVAQAFHALCDIYEPTVNRAILFFTIDINEVEPKLVNSKNPLKIAESYLKTKWQRALEPHILDPLITRMTENVFFIY
jgi:hypothetical protein